MNSYVNILEIGGLNILLALSVYATFMVGQFSLAQVGFWSIGAVVTGMLTSMYGFALLPSLAAAAALCVFVGLLLGYPCLRIRGIYLALATVAFSEVVRVFFHNFTYKVDIGGAMVGPGGPLGFVGIRVLTAWPQILVAVVVIFAALVCFERSRLGLSAKAIREDETAAAAAGIDVVAIKVGMFAFGAAIAAVGGGLYGTYLSSINTDNFGFHLALLSIFYVAVGGTERATGPMVGAMVLTILPELLRGFGDWRMIVYGLIVLVLTLVFPRGIVREFRVRRRTSVPTPLHTREPQPTPTPAHLESSS
jgi:branched-chain amino acid transport system permease protein